MSPARIEVICRVRPTDKPDNESVHVLSDNASIQVNRHARGRSGSMQDGKPIGGSSNTPVQTSQCFTFDRVLSGAGATQENVYLSSASKLVEMGVLNGTGATLLCYGEKHSGKSYTMFGGSDYRSRGIAPRAIHHLYAGIAEAAEDRSFRVSITFLQLFGEQVIDLLGGCSRGAVTLDGNGEVVLKNIVKRPCQSEAEALAALFEGLQAHRTSPNSKYGHLVVTLYVQQQSLSDTVAESRHACLHLVDLAGTQRVDGVASHEDRVAVQSVNRSLSLLEQVVIALASSSNEDSDFGGGASRANHIPYRQSKLTTLLKGCVGGRCLTTMIAHVRVDKGHVETTSATLNFAKRMTRVAADPQVNTVMDTEAQVRLLQREVTELKADLRLQTQMNTKAAAAPPPAAGNQSTGNARKASRQSSPSPQAAASTATGPVMGVDELSQLHDRVGAYVDGSVPVLRVNDIREMHACFAFMRGLIEQKDVKIVELNNKVATMANNASSLPQGPGGMAGDNNNSMSPQSSKTSGRGRMQHRASMQGRQGSTTSVLDSHSPNILDKNAGVGYGTAAKAKITAGGAAPPANASSMMGGGSAPPSPRWEHQLEQPHPSPPRRDGAPPRPPPLLTTEPLERRAHSAATGRSNLSAAASPFAAMGGKRAAPGSGGAAPRIVVDESSHNSTRRDRGEPKSTATTAAPSGSSTSAPGELETASSSLLHWKVQRAVNSEKTAAFEAYKLTPSGSIQLSALHEDQQRLAQRQSAVKSLQDRLINLVSAMQIREGMELAAGGGLSMSSRPGTTASMAPGSRLAGRHMHTTGASAPTLLPMIMRADGGSTTSPPKLDDSLASAQLARDMTLAQISASVSHTQDELSKTLSERLHLVRQIDRRRMAFLNNFDDWYANTGASDSGARSNNNTYSMTAGSGTASRPATTTSAATARIQDAQSYEANYLASVEDSSPEALKGMLTIQQDKFLDASERFDAMEVQRQIAQDPDSAAYFTAKKLIEARGRTGGARRPSGTGAAATAVFSATAPAATSR